MRGSVGSNNAILLKTKNEAEIGNGKQEGDKVVLIDTDAGTDDAWAIFMALAAEKDLTNPGFQIVGITTVSGNTTVDNVANNVTRTLDTFGNTTIPIYKGMDSPMINEFRFLEDPPYNGEDGFGDADLPSIPTRIQPEHSVDAIIRLAELYAGKLTIICLGPGTNLAMALKLRPEITNQIKEIFILGGNIEGIGNVQGVSSSSEFNFYVDPESIQVIFQNASPIPISVLPWETMTRFATSTYGFRTEFLGNIRTPQIELLNKIEKKNLDNIKEFWMAPDPVLLACVIDPRVIKRREDFYCSVELQGSLTRGMMVLDRNEVQQKPPNVSVIMEVDLQIYELMLTWAAGGPKP